MSVDDTCVVTKSDTSQKQFGYVQTDDAVSHGSRTWYARMVVLDVCLIQSNRTHCGWTCLSRCLAILKKPSASNLFIGIAAAGEVPDKRDGFTDDAPSSYGIWSSGVLITAGASVKRATLSSTAITRPDLFKQRRECDKVFAAGDKVTVTMDCDTSSVRFQSPTVDHTSSIYVPADQQPISWVLNINFGPGDHAVLFSHYGQDVVEV